MFIPMLEVFDRSYYVDELEKLTGKPRRYWARLPLFVLRKHLAREMRLWVLEMSSLSAPALDGSDGREQRPEAALAQAG